MASTTEPSIHQPLTNESSEKTYSEDGISMDNIYYDNVMHICVYEGKKSLYAKDITKQMFVDVIPTDFCNRPFYLIWILQELTAKAIIIKHSSVFRKVRYAILWILPSVSMEN